MIPKLEKQLFISVRNYCKENLNVDMFRITKDQVNRHNFLLKRTRKKQHQAPGNVSIQILQNGAPGLGKSLLLTTNQTHYLFNCGEGSQRIAHEFKMKISKIDHIFITSCNWRHMGGLPGMSLTMQSIGLQSVQLHGPAKVNFIFESLKEFIFFPHFNVSIVDCDPNRPFQDSTMTLFYVRIKEQLERDGIKKVKLDLRDRGDGDSLSYVCKFVSRPGKLDLHKCLDKGVPPGPLLGDLKNGKDITLSDGRIIKSSEVLDPAVPGPIIIVADCPTQNHLKSFVNAETFQKHQASCSNKDDIAFCVFHFTPQDIIDLPEYQQWMKNFGETTKHVLINEDNRGLSSEAIHVQQHKLNTLEPELFPILGEFVENRCAEEEGNSDPSIHRGKILNTVDLQPVKQFNTTPNINVDSDTCVEEILKLNGFSEALARFQAIKNDIKKTTRDEEYPKIVMLGTGSSIPSKTRNTSSILLRVDENHSIVLDCGEGTIGQLTRFYGKSKVYDILSTIKGIYVSHNHADHHIGLIGLILERCKISQEKFNLLAPSNIVSWLKMYHQHFESILDKFNLIETTALLSNRTTFNELDYQNLCHSLNIKEIRTTLVRHCVLACGVSLTLKDGKKIVYSGDTMPCNSLIELGQNCDLLIHEATMEDELLLDAQEKTHSTISQAIQVGIDMNADFILLTHFSQRYHKTAILPQDKCYDFEKIGMAFDNMDITFSTLRLIPSLLPCLGLIFKEYIEDMEDRTMKYKKKYIV